MVRPGQVKVISGPTKPASAAPKATPQVKGPAIKPLPQPTKVVAQTQKNPTLFPTAAGGALAGKVASAPGNAMNKVVLDAWRASGGTTTNKYVDKYSNPTNPGESALQEAKRLQEQGAAKIFDRVQQAASREAVAAGRPAIKRTVYTRTLDDEGTKQDVSTGEIIPPEKKIIASPIDQAEPETKYSPAAITRPYQAPPMTLNTNSLTNNLPPAKGTLQGAVLINARSPAAYLSANLNAIKASIPLMNAMPGMGGIADMFKGLIQQLAPGVTARISAKGARRR